MNVKNNLEEWIRQFPAEVIVFGNIYVKTPDGTVYSWSAVDDLLHPDQPEKKDDEESSLLELEPGDYDKLTEKEKELKLKQLYLLDRSKFQMAEILHTTPDIIDQYIEKFQVQKLRW